MNISIQLDEREAIVGFPRRLYVLSHLLIFKIQIYKY